MNAQIRGIPLSFLSTRIIRDHDVLFSAMIPFFFPKCFDSLILAFCYKEWIKKNFLFCVSLSPLKYLFLEKFFSLFHTNRHLRYNNLIFNSLKESHLNFFFLAINLFCSIDSPGTYVGHSKYNSTS